MHVECPNCANPIDVPLDQPAIALTCPSCGSTVSLFDPERTATYREAEVGAIGRFQLIEHVGRGHFGDVWRARDATLDREVALKVPRKEDLDHGDIEIFLREARAAARLCHPNVVRVHEIGKAGNAIFIVSEYIRGINLAEWLMQYKPAPDQAARLCATLAEALHHAHEAGVVHRDLKPGNVLMDDGGRPHLTDFGLAKRDGAEITMTVDGKILGTPAYMSPEQARGDAHHADRRSDVYSLGVMLFEMLTGQKPFQGKSKHMLLHQVLNDDPPLPRKLKKNVPRDLQTICMKAMAKEPEGRYQTAQDMADDLRRFIEGKPIAARPARAWERGWRWARRNPLPAMLGSSTAVFGVALIVAVAVKSPRPPGAGSLPPGVPPSNRDAVVARSVRFTTDPPGAKVVFVPLDRDTGEPLSERAYQPEMPTPLHVDLEPARYFVVAVIPDHGFLEFYRTVPTREEEHDSSPYPYDRWTLEGTTVELPAARMIRDEEAIKGLVRVAGGAFDMGIPGGGNDRLHLCAVEDFWVQPVEVSVGDWRRVMGTIPAALADENPADTSPIRYVSYGAALEYAEKSGLRLPKEAEYEILATRRGTQALPWGDDFTKITAWRIDDASPPDYDVTTDPPGVRGLFSRVAEWTDSLRNPYPGAESEVPAHLPPQIRANLIPPRVLEQHRRSHVVRGGPYSVVTAHPKDADWSGGARWGHAIDDTAQFPGLGLRCYRSAAPRFAASGEP